MPSQLPGQMTLPTRDEIKARFKASAIFKSPDLKVEDPQLEADAAVTADVCLPLYANQRIYASNSVLEDATGVREGFDDALLQWGRREGVGDPLGAAGSSGFVIISASAGGTPIDDGQDLVDPVTSLHFHAVIPGGGSQTFFDGEYCAIQASSTGPDTNLGAGRSLDWNSPSPGSGPSVVVSANADGSGLIGGRNEETEDEYRLRIRNEKADRSRSSNDADYRRAVSSVPGIRVLQAFTWPAINGTGTTAAAALLAPSRPGGSRVPSEAQRALIESTVVAQMPADDGAFYPVLAEQNVDIVYQLSWAREASGWADVNPWPRYYAAAGTPGAVIVNSAADATHFVLRTANNNYTGIRQPVAGQTVAFYNQAGGAFARKRILSVTGTGPWTIVVDTTNNSSDTTYVPIVNQRAMPWSESLPSLLAKTTTAVVNGQSVTKTTGIHAYFDSLGPGEMSASIFDAGKRRKRQPEAPREWPNVLTTKGLEEAIDIDEVLDRDAVEGPGTTTTVGTAGVIAYQMRLRWVSVFPQ